MFSGLEQANRVVCFVSCVCTNGKETGNESIYVVVEIRPKDYIFGVVHSSNGLVRDIVRLLESRQQNMKCQSQQQFVTPFSHWL